MIENEKETQEVDTFTEKTIKEGTWWEWIAKILPLVAICTITVLHFFRLHNVRDLILDVIVIIFFFICFVWWFWAIQKIVAAAKYLRRSQHRFSEIAEELRKIKNNFRNNDSNR